MSWNDPCGDCHEPKRDCICPKHELKEQYIQPEPDSTILYKIVESVFFGGESIHKENLTLDDARKFSGHNSDVYTSYYIIPQHIDIKTENFHKHVVYWFSYYDWKITRI